MSGGESLTRLPALTPRAARAGSFTDLISQIVCPAAALLRERGASSARRGHTYSDLTRSFAGTLLKVAQVLPYKVILILYLNNRYVNCLSPWSGRRFLVKMKESIGGAKLHSLAHHMPLIGQ